MPGRFRAWLVGPVTAALALLGAERTAEAYRPFDGTDASVAELGLLELEVAPIGYVGQDGAHYWAAPGLVANLGFAPRFELVAEGRELVGLSDAAGRGMLRLVDTQLTVKAVLLEGALQGGSGLSLATEFGPLLPMINDQRGAGFIASLIGSETSEWGSVHVNLVGKRTRAANADLFAGVILEGPVRWAARPVVEIFYEREFRAAQTFSILDGVILRASDDFNFDAALRLSRVDATNAVEVRAGFTWAIRLWGEH
jgi:hypothetical protein